MNSEEYDLPDLDGDETDSHYRVCRFCSLDFGDHEHTCPYGGPDDDPAFCDREGDRTFRDPREVETWGP